MFRLLLLCLLVGRKGKVMPNDFYSGSTTVVPVLHKGEGEVHNVQVPTDLNIGDLHSALLDSNYHVPVSNAQPTKEGSLEYDPTFQLAAKEAWKNSGEGRTERESGFAIDKNGIPNQMQYHDRNPGDRSGTLAIRTPANSIATLHTHPDVESDQPSDEDRQAAVKSGKFMYVVSRRGLFLVDGHNNGKVTQVFDNTDFLKDKKKGK